MGERLKIMPKHLHHILDDFLLLTNPKPLAPKQREIFETTSDVVGVPLKAAKIEHGDCLEYFGIEVDASQMQARLPPDKIAVCVQAIKAILSKGSVIQEKLASLVGMLNFACKVVRPGRAFLRRMYSYLYSVPKATSNIHLDVHLSGDLKMWLVFLANYNGVAIIHEPKWVTSKTLHCYTDAAKQHGFGIVFGDQWAFGEFPREWKEKDIFCLEAFPVMLVFHMFHDQLENKKLLIHTDNGALVSTLRTQSCGNPLTMVFVRDLVLAALKYNIIFDAVHIPGKLNTLADTLSRLKVEKFWEEANKLGIYMRAQPTQVPSRLLPGNYSLQ